MNTFNIGDRVCWADASRSPFGIVLEWRPNPWRLAERQVLVLWGHQSHRHAFGLPSASWVGVDCLQLDNP
jgi:hypothetical protein